MKFAEVSEKSDAELEVLEEKLRKELSDLRLKAGMGQLAQSSKLGHVRRDVARILTARKSRLKTN